MLRPLINFYQRHATRRMFSRWSPIYEEDVQENAYSAAEEVAKATIKYLVKSGSIHTPRIADIGIGTGLLAQKIHDAIPIRISGLDFSEDMMAACAGRGITELLLKCDVGKDYWPLEANSQDVVISAGLFEYLMPDMAQHYLAQSSRVLQQKGLLIFTYLPSEGIPSKLTFWRGHSGNYLICGYAEDEIEGWLSRSNFTLLEHTPPFKGCIFSDGSSYDYRLIVAKKS